MYLAVLASRKAAYWADTKPKVCWHLLTLLVADCHFQEEKEQRCSNPRSPSPDSRHQQESSPEEKQLKGASAISDVMPTDLFRAGQAGAAEDQNMQNKEQDQEVAPLRRSRSKLAVLFTPGTIRVCTESEPRPQTAEQLTASYEASAQARESNNKQTVEGAVNSRRPASAYLPWGRARTAPKLEDKSLHKDECEGGLLDRPARPMSGHALSRPSGAAHVKSAVRTLLQDLNAGSESAMRSILKLSRHNQQGDDRFDLCPMFLATHQASSLHPRR